MKLLSAVLLTFFVCLVRGSEDDCIGEEVLDCFNILKLDVSPEDECGIVRSSVECLRVAMEIGLCNEREKELEAGLKKLEKLSKKLCPRKEDALIAESLIHDIEDEVINEQRRKCLSKLSSKFSSTEERCREIGKALNCLRDAKKKLHDDDYVYMISELKTNYARSCEKKKYKDGCPKLLTEEYGTIYSPGFRRNKSGIVDCWTRIQVNESKGLVLLIDWLGIDTTIMLHEGNCTSSSEYIEVHRRKEGELMSVLDEKMEKIIRSDERKNFCDDRLFFTDHSTVLIHIHSEDPVNDLGYNVIFTSKNKSSESQTRSDLGLVDEIKEEDPECVKKNAGFIFRCLKRDHSKLEAVSPLEDMGYDLSWAECPDYEEMAHCFVRRTKDVCNETVAYWAVETVTNSKIQTARDACAKKGFLLKELDPKLYRTFLNGVEV